MKKTLLSGFLTAALTFGSVFSGLAAAAQPVHAASFRDISSHWAKSYILEAADKGIIAGYPDGTFLPDKPVTRAEFTKMVNNALGNTASSAISFSDVASVEWYYNEISRAIAAGYAGGYDDGRFLPNNKITRQEAAVMLARIVPTYNYGSSLRSYGDYSSVSDWAESCLSRIVGKKYMGAYDDGKLHPLDSLTRAQAAKIITDIVKKESIVKTPLTIREDGTKVSGKIYSNGITIHKDVENGSVTIDNCVVLGPLYVQGGGADADSKDGSVTISNSRVASMQISRTASAVRVIAKNETRILDTSIWKNAAVETNRLSGGLFGTGFDKITVLGDSEVIFDGNFPHIVLSGVQCRAKLSSGTVTTLDVESSARKSEIDTDRSVTVTTANVNAAAAFTGSGTIRTMNANASGITYTTKPDRVNVKSGVSAPTLGEENADIAITPKSGATDVAIDSDIKLTFDAAMSKSNGKSISDSDLEEMIKLRRKTSSGTKVAFSAKINSAKKVITITPTESLDYQTRYYVIIDSDTFRDSSGNKNKAFSSYFTTEAEEKSGISVSPSKNAKDVDIGTTIKLSFDSAIKRYNGSELRDSNLNDLIDDDKIRLCTDAKGKHTVSIKAEINSKKKIITITPRKELSYDTKYYLFLDKNIFKNSKNEGNAAFSSSFTTVADTFSISSLTSTSTDNSFSIDVKPGANGDLYGVLLPSGAKAPSAAQIKDGKDGSGSALSSGFTWSKTKALRGSSCKQTFSGLDANTSYTFYAVLYSGSKYSAVKSTTLSTKPLPGAKLTGLSVAGASLSPSFDSSKTSYAVTLPFGTTELTLTATAESNCSVQAQLGGGAPQVVTAPLTLDGLSSTQENKIQIRVSDLSGKKTTTTYTLSVTVAGNTSVSTPSVTANGKSAQSTGSLSKGNLAFLVDSDTSSVQISISADDPNASIKCSKLSPAAGTGTLSGTLTLAADSTTVSFTVESNRDRKEYSFSVEKLNPSGPDPSAPNPPTPGPSTPSTGEESGQN